jgi:hypothetical protein
MPLFYINMSSFGITYPDAFFITDHYRGYPMLLVRLATVEEDDLRDLPELAWRSLAPKRLLNALEPVGE